MNSVLGYHLRREYFIENYFTEIKRAMSLFIRAHFILGLRLAKLRG